jgi:hypothetical protein
MNELTINFNDKPTVTEDGQNKNGSTYTLLKTAKEYELRLTSFFTLLKNRYDQILKTHNLDELREFMIRLNDTHVTVTHILKELLRSEKRIQSQLLQTTGNAPLHPIIVLPEQAEQVTEIGKEITALQKELSAFCLE